jgi:hypothetical protein
MMLSASSIARKLPRLAHDPRAFVLRSSTIALDALSDGEAGVSLPDASQCNARAGVRHELERRVSNDRVAFVSIRERTGDHVHDA